MKRSENRDDSGKTGLANGGVDKVEEREELGAEKNVAVENADVVGGEVATDVAHDAADERHEVRVVSLLSGGGTTTGSRGRRGLPGTLRGG